MIGSRQLSATPKAEILEGLASHMEISDALEIRQGCRFRRHIV